MRKRLKDSLINNIISIKNNKINKYNNIEKKNINK